MGDNKKTHTEYMFIDEGKVRKGGINRTPPQRARPSPPAGQGAPNSVELKRCPSCGECIEPGKLVTSSGSMEVWFCSCGKWFKVDHRTGEHSAWARTWAHMYKRK